jgi:hypothetical protein
MKDDTTTENMRNIGALAAIEMPKSTGCIFAIVTASGTRGAVGAVYFARNSAAEPPNSYPLVIVDWDLDPIESSLPEYPIKPAERIRELLEECQTFNPRANLVWAEPEGLGKAIIQNGLVSSWRCEAIPEPYAELDLAERAHAALPYVHMGQVKIARPAFEKTVNFRGTARNHLRTQIADFTREQGAEDAELLSAWCFGIILCLDDPPRRKTR